AGATVWQWSNAVEVYSLQLFATALTLLGIASSAGSRRRHLLAGIGIGIGLANHHVATVVLVPFLVPVVARLRGIGLAAAARGLLPALGIALGVAVLAYGALAVSAADANAFQFGEPDTPARLWHHLRGGFFADSLWRDGVDYGGRAEVLFTVLARHLVAFAIPAALGVAIAWRRARALLWLGLGYPVALFALQLGRMHTPNMDAGLLPALATLGVPVALGLAAFRGRWPLWFGLAALALQLAVNFAAADRRGYAPGRAVLADLEASMPPRAIALVSSWELLTLSRLAIEADGFRPDAIVVPASLKGTHRDLLARHYPEFHAAVRTEYEAWLDAIAALDPDWVYTDFFELRDAATTASYAALARKVLAVGAADDRPVVCDRETVRLLLRAGIVTDTAVTPCGRLFALGREVASPPPFPLAPGWLDHSFLMHDLCALGTLHDYKTTAAQIAGYYRHRGRRELAAAAETARDRLDSLWLHYLAGKPAPRRP
ncbi:MAG: DUF2723 domain-containing protein, partial [Planctomycetes bacterium]|nr:DUF2723 domain-containing protein [Planctomycetota bacterium]